MNNTPTVYLLQEPTSDKDLSSAAKQGRIVPIISNTERPSNNIPATIDKIASHLKYYNPMQDSICFAGGDPVVLFLAGVVLERLGYDEVTHLVWNRERVDGQKTGSGFYMPKRVSLIEGNPDNFMAGD